MSAKKNQSALEMLKNNLFKKGVLYLQVQKDIKEGKQIPKNVTYKNTSINSASTDRKKESVTKESELNSENDNQEMAKYYGTNLSYEQVQTYINDLKSNSMAAVKDPDYSKKLKFLNNYEKTYGYKNKSYSNKDYLSSVVKRADKYFSDREALENRTKTFSESGYSAKNDAENLQNQYRHMRSEAKELSKQLKENKESFSEDYYSSITELLKDDTSTLKKKNKQIGKYNEWLNSFENENEYNIYKRNSSALSENPSWEELSNRKEELEKRRGFYSLKGYNDEVSEIDKDIKWLDQFTKNNEERLKYEADWLNPDGETSVEKVAARKEFYERNKKRIKELEDEINKCYVTEPVVTADGGIVAQNYRTVIKDQSRYDELTAEKEALESENRQYKRTQGIMDSYFDITIKPDFEAVSAKRNYTNPSKEYLDRYDIAMDVSTWYTDAENNQYNAFGEKINQYYHVTENNSYEYNNKPVINDMLGMFLSTDKDKRKQAYDSVTEGSWASVIKSGIVGDWDRLTESEIGTYYYLLNNEGQASANKYLYDMKTELNRRATAEMTEKIKKAEGFEKFAMNVAAIPAGIFGSFASFIDDTVSTLTGNDINPYSHAHELSNFSNDVIADTANDIDEWSGNAKLLGFSLGDVYQYGMSAAEAYFGSKLGSKIYGSLMGMNAASSKAKQLYENGASNGQIISLSMLTGGAEMIFETLSIEHFLGLKNTKQKRQAAFNIVSHVGVEVTEEVNTYLANSITDFIVMGSQSDWSKNVKSYMDDGKSKAEATALALGDSVFDLWKTAGGAFFAGSIISGIKSAKSYQEYQKVIKQNGQKILDNGSFDSLKTFAEDFASKSTSDVKKKINKALNKAEANMNAGNVGNLLEVVLEQTQIRDISGRIQSKMKETGEVSDDVDSIAKSVLKSLSGEQLSLSEKNMLKKNSAANEVLSEFQKQASAGNAGQSTQMRNKDFYTSTDANIQNNFGDGSGGALIQEDEIGYVINEAKDNGLDSGRLEEAYSKLEFLQKQGDSEAVSQQRQIVENELEALSQELGIGTDESIQQAIYDSLTRKEELKNSPMKSNAQLAADYLVDKWARKNGYSEDGHIDGTRLTKLENEFSEIVKSKEVENDTYIPQMNTGEDGETRADDNYPAFSVDDEIIDRYTDKQYNNFGWISVNQVLTKNEWSQYNNKLRETLSSKIPRNINGEHVMTVGEHSSDITALVYLKGTAGNPIVTKVVRVNKNILNNENISVILEELADYERQGYRKPYSYVESIYEQKIFDVNQRKDFKSLSELQVERKGNFGIENQKNNRIKHNGAGSTNTNNEIEAGLDKSAFSIEGGNYGSTDEITFNNDIQQAIYDSLTRKEELKNSPMKSNAQLAADYLVDKWAKKNGYSEDGIDDFGDINSQDNSYVDSQLNSSVSDSIIENSVDSMLENPEDIDNSDAIGYNHKKNQYDTVFFEDVPSYVEVIDGKVGGKIDKSEYDTIRSKSIKNPFAGSIMLGKYTNDNSSYIVKAGKTSSYFDLGESWNEIKLKYDLSDKEMFDYFNKPALDYAINDKKQIKFSHDPINNDGFLNCEWEYIKKVLGLTDDDLIKGDDIWYVKK